MAVPLVGRLATPTSTRTRSPTGWTSTPVCPWPSNRPLQITRVPRHNGRLWGPRWLSWNREDGAADRSPLRDGPGALLDRLLARSRAGRGDGRVGAGLRSVGLRPLRSPSSPRQSGRATGPAPATPCCHPGGRTSPDCHRRGPDPGPGQLDAGGPALGSQAGLSMVPPRALLRSAPDVGVRDLARLLNPEQEHPVGRAVRPSTTVPAVSRPPLLLLPRPKGRSAGGRPPGRPGTLRRRTRPPRAVLAELAGAPHQDVEALRRCSACAATCWNGRWRPRTPGRRHGSRAPGVASLLGVSGPASSRRRSPGRPPADPGALRPLRADDRGRPRGRLPAQDAGVPRSSRPTVDLLAPDLTAALAGGPAAGWWSTCSPPSMPTRSTWTASRLDPGGAGPLRRTPAAGGRRPRGQDGEGAPGPGRAGRGTRRRGRVRSRRVAGPPGGGRGDGRRPALIGRPAAGSLRNSYVPLTTGLRTSGPMVQGGRWPRRSCRARR